LSVFRDVWEGDMIKLLERLAACSATRARPARGQPVTTYNGGANPVLNPIYVDDAVETFVRAAGACSTTS
jgi:nucleoside-diphosphate-sugar epimerase